MKKKDVFSLVNAIMACGNLSGEKFTYTMAKNISHLQSVVEKIREEMDALQQKHVKRDKEKKPIFSTEEGKEDNYVMKDLGKYKDESVELAREEIEVKLFKVKQAELPANITLQQRIGIESLIEE